MRNEIELWSRESQGQLCILEVQSSLLESIRQKQVEDVELGKIREKVF